MKEIDHTVFIQEWKLYLDTAAYLNNLGKKGKTYIKEKEIDRHDSQ